MPTSICLVSVDLRLLPNLFTLISKFQKQKNNCGQYGCTYKEDSAPFTGLEFIKVHDELGQEDTSGNAAQYGKQQPWNESHSELLCFVDKGC
jgi:hypothetical protein